MTARHATFPQAQQGDVEPRKQSDLSGALLRTLFEESPLSVQVLASSGMTLAVNRGWEEFWGSSLEDLGDYNILQDPQLEALGVAPLLRRAFAGERVEIPPVGYVPDRGEFKGSVRWVRAIAAPVRDGMGEIAHVLLIHQDDTGATKARNRLERLRELLEESQRNAHVGTWERDIRTDSFTWTDELYRIHGLEPDSPLTYDEILELIHPDDRVNIRTAVQRSSEDGQPFAIDYRIVRPDGEIRWLHGQGRAVLDAGGTVVQLIGSSQDITERVIAESARERLLAGQRALAEAGRKFAEAESDVSALLDEVARQAAASVGDGSTIWLLEQGGLSLRPVASHHPNPAALEASRDVFTTVQHGAGEGIVGRVAMTGAPAIVQSTDPDELRDRAHPAYRSLLTQVPAFGLLAVPMRARGRALGVLATSRSEPGHPYDETDQALLQELGDRAALAIDNASLVRDAQEAQRRYRGVFEGVADAILIADDDRRYRDANAAATTLLGYSYEELMSLRVEDIAAASTEWTAEEFAQYQSEGRWQGELELRRKDGSLVPVEAVATVIDLPAGRVYISVLRDVSERRHSQHQQQAFLEAVSHDLKNPLASVRAQAQLLARRARRGVMPDTTGLIEVAEAIESATGRMQSQLEELQDIVRLRSGHPLELRVAEVDLAALCEAAAADAQAAAPHHRIRIDETQRSVIGIWDPLRLRRVLDNLLDNAVKYSPAGGTVTVTVNQVERQGTSGAIVTVEDAGVGIPPGDLPRVFERYWRGSNVGSRIGTGIGLAGVRQIVEQHGGVVSVASVEGQGSQFTITLPLDRLVDLDSDP